LGADVKRAREEWREIDFSDDKEGSLFIPLTVQVDLVETRTYKCPRFLKAKNGDRQKNDITIFYTVMLRL